MNISEKNKLGTLGVFIFFEALSEFGLSDIFILNNNYYIYIIH
jgi:hypothetical protein